MKLSLLAALSAPIALGQVTTAAVAVSSMPMQTFFVPLGETEMFYDIFQKINKKRAKAPVNSFISVACSTDDTVIWWDHWEDGYELDAMNRTSTTTEVWGDGDASNGCAPSVDSCTDANDKLNAGDTVVAENIVDIVPARDPSVIKYDGSDRIQASHPIAITRGGYPATPGSLMAGAIEVYDTSAGWGQEFEAPVGEDIGKNFKCFQVVSLFFMAACDDTHITLPDGTEIVLNQGESSSVSINSQDKLSSDKDIQVHLISGDANSYYELRWYSLLPTNEWSNSYVSPVGDSHGKTKILLYNPGTTEMDITWQYLDENNITQTDYKTMKPKKVKLTDVIPTGSGAFVTAPNNFMALSLTDTEYRTATGQATGSQWYDWGFPVLPEEKLTSQVIIGWGFGCTGNQCYQQDIRSVIWVTPVDDADIYIDYDNSGDNYDIYSAKQLQSYKFSDQSDTDMSGAIIFATAPGSGVDGSPVNIAAAWGQDPLVSKKYQSISLDLGTVIPPFPTLRVSKFVDKTDVSPGETLTYTIRLINSGQSMLEGLSLTLSDTLDEMVSYVPESTTYTVEGLTRSIADGSSGTAFPFDESGFLIPFDLEKRGGTLDITFEVILDGTITGTTVLNTGSVTGDGNVLLPFEASSNVVVNPQVQIDNKAYLGADGGALCGTDTPQDLVQDVIYNGDVTYCFNVTNTGDTLLTGLFISNEDLNFTDTSVASLLPGESVMIYFTSTISVDLVNMANVTATPKYGDGSVIDGQGDVYDGDESEVKALAAAPDISIDNTVYLGADDGQSCDTDAAVDYVENYESSNVTYCFNVTNTGNTYLGSVIIDNTELAISDNSIGGLAPGESAMVAVSSTLAGALTNNAIVTANPVYKDGEDIAGLDDVTATDPSEVGVLEDNASITITNVVYDGADSGASCGTATNQTAGFTDANVTYCFNVTNNGGTFLSVKDVNVPALSYTDNSIGLLAPGESRMIVYEATFDGNYTNMATVTATPVTSAGVEIPSLDEVTAQDDSAITTTDRDGDVKLGDKDPYKPPNDDPTDPSSCLQNSYDDNPANSDELICTTEDVFLETLSAEEAMSCVSGDTITITVDASIRVEKALYDLGWYVATDGGDALNGTCVVNGLQDRNTYDVVDGAGSSDVIGSVAWDKDVQDNDVCGDVFMSGTGGGNIDIPIIVELPVPCTDENEDGNLDISVCFSWRTEATDDVCTLDANDANTVGTLADMYPGETSGCYCLRYDIANVKVAVPTVDKVKPC